MFNNRSIVYTGKFSLEGIDTIWIRERHRDIIFLHGEGEELEVREFGTTETEMIRVEQRGSALCLEGGDDRPHLRLGIAGSFGSIGMVKGQRKIELTVPSGFQGQIYAESASGDISLGGMWTLWNLQVKTRSGDSSVGSVRAEHILIESTSGDIDVKEAWGSRQLFSVSGDICLEGGRGRLQAGTTSGDMAMGGMDTWTELESVSGDIGAKFAGITQPVKITTVSGDMDIKIPDDSNVSIEGRTINGDIVAHLGGAQISTLNEHSVSARMGSGSSENTPVMDIQSVSGDICVIN